MRSWGVDAPLLFALVRARLRVGGSVQNVLVSPRALILQWAPERRAGLEAGLAWVFLINPSPELWLLHEKDEAFRLLKGETKVDLSRRWGQELKGARLEDLEGDPRERWLGILFRRTAVTGRIEVSRLAYQAIPGRGGLRLDGLDLNPARMGMGSPFPAQAPEPAPDSPPMKKWRERFGENLEAALAGENPEVLPGEGTLFARHRAWSLERADKLLLAPKKAGVDRKLVVERHRLERYGEALAQDRARHEAALGLREKAKRLSAELYRLHHVQGVAELSDGTRVELPPGLRAEVAAQKWFAAVKRAERGLGRVAELERERLRQVLELEAAGVPAPPPVIPKPQKESRKMERKDKRADGKGKAFRSVMIEGFEALIGKGDADNDALTFKVGAPLDFWLHVAGVPGSHVIVRNPDKVSELPRPVLERAAELAAFFSKARDGGKVEVHWCRVADVSKPRGFAPGKVMLKTFKSVRVYPKE
ncbi:NFACT RNA binding domain-containing protein [Holophaga foetida]|uniref:NFACT RNA binding domain-containing protein n=1 Tax=Holophaga foetida TaxID=35839 RepID=UPI0002472EDD|nr:NFACT RNA binding domain-containing protein [Holophaga foetida]